MVNIDFNLDSVEAATSYEPLPTGWYELRIVGSEQKMTKAGDGKYLQIEFEPDESAHPEIKGRQIWQRYNLWNQNKTTVEIAQRDFKSLVQACGESSINDSEQLHGITVPLRIGSRSGDGGIDRG